MANFTLQDIRGSAVAVLAFALVLCAPGWVLAQVTNLFGFRRRSFAERALWAIACSFGVMPIAAYLGTKYARLDAVCWASVLLAVWAVGLIVRDRARTGLRTGSRWSWSRREWMVAAAGCAWALFVFGSLVDAQVGNKLYFNVAIMDQTYRVAFTNAVLRTGVPPANPLYFAGHSQPMRYYYFWYIECAMVARIAHVTARQAFIASSVWAGFGLCAMIALYTRYFFGVVRDVRRQTWLAVGLLAVTGADLLPALGNLFGQPVLNGDMEWWSVDQISSWTDSLLWVPHHVAGLLCCLLSFLLLWRTRELESRRQRWLAVGLAGISFASGFGLSIYVAFGLALLMLAWLILLLMHGRRDLGLCGRVLAAGVVSAAAMAPFVRELTAARSTLETGGSAQASHVFVFSVRRMIAPELLSGLPLFAVWNRAHPVLLDQALRLLLLLPGLGLELGFYGAVVVLLLLAWKRAGSRGERLGEAHRTALYLAICGLAMVLFVRSTVSNNNDFGFRAALLPQFFLLLLGASLLASWWFGDPEAAVVAATPKSRRIVYGLMALGLAGSLFQAVMLRAFLPVEANRAGSGFAYLPVAALQAREAFAKLDRVTPGSAHRPGVVEFNPVDPDLAQRDNLLSPFTYFTRLLLMDSGRQVLDSEPACGTEFGGDTSDCAAMMQATAQLYAAPAPPADWATAYCKRFGVDYLVATLLDPAWQDASGWARTLPVFAAEPDLRILDCARLDRNQ